LSGMEDMFEMDEESEVESAIEEGAEDTEGLGLDLDLELEDAGDQAESEVEEDEEIDLSEMEELLEADEESVNFDEAGAEILEDLDLESEETDAPEEETAIEDESMDLSDLEEMMEEGESAEEDADSVEDSLEDMLDLDESEIEGAEQAVDSASADEAMDLDAGDEFEEADEAFEEALSQEEEVAEPKKKKRVSTPVLILLILVLLGGGGYGAYTVMGTMGIEIPNLTEIGSKIPFVGQYIKPPVPDAGNLKISTLGITGKFVNSPKAGKLFVISGKANNGYDHARGMIKVVGKLFSKGKKLEKSETVFCGNNLTEEELNTLDIETIKNQLKVKAGKNKSNMKIVSHRVIPFMVVFSDLPENLDEYTIEVVESVPALK